MLVNLLSRLSHTPPISSAINILNLKVHRRPSLHGVLERTRGDLTTAIHQQGLEQRLAQLWEHVTREGID